MIKIKTENWNGYPIRFVEKESGEWWAVAVDIAKALSYPKVDSMIRKLRPNQKGTQNLRTLGGEQELSIISEQGLYKIIMRSSKPEAEAFEEWLYSVIKTLREASGLEGFQVFRMLDKEHQKDAMKRLQNGLRLPVRVDFMKANTIANKAVSTVYGHKKIMKKGEMTPDMLVQRGPILDDTVQLMSMSDKFDLGLSVSNIIYTKYAKNVV